MPGIFTGRKKNILLKEKPGEEKTTRDRWVLRHFIWPGV